ncbi:sporulation integral membrane protein YlbJ [Paenibacillus aurantius]|uniref:Sporulation integral membrane protein YlbJ n=1 Tax=Paenibacillus aurantius TaxID=2918900 RepID=A0AA96RG14_9BACL|nr:sporulation integral membrane protein YlbJ [Paenibacillus aurantius]WNQ12582.1 sporulation integral membrane protein YlbJ [Paenibacillus aurantius]
MSSLRIHSLYLPAAASLAFFVLLLRFPAEGMEAAVRGVAIWWDVLFPALFPFFLLSEMLLGFGIVHFFGTLLDPLMRPVFRIPGIGGFVMAMGFASGYPVGARLTAQLWEQKLISREEGERLVAFTTSSDPIFLIGAVSVGFFSDGRIALLLAASHYGAAMLLGFLMRFHGRGTPATPRPSDKGGGSLLRRSFDAMHQARIRDGRSIGTLLQQGIATSLSLIFVVGALVVFFSVLMETMRSSHLLDLFYGSVNTLLQGAGFPRALSEAVVNGFFEVTLGAKAAGQAGPAVPLVYKAAVAAFVLSWGGLSVHAQIVSLLHRTNLRYAPFLAARLLHAVMAACLAVLLWPLMSGLLGTSAVMAWTGTLPPAEVLVKEAVFPLSLTFSGFLAVLLAVGLVLHWFSKRRYNGLEK